MASRRNQQAKDPPDGFAPLPMSAYGRLIGPILEADGGRVRGFRVSAKHINRAGLVHGGMLMSFADGVLGSSIGRAGHGAAVTVRMTTEFLAPAHHGDWVEGHARITRATRTLVYVEGEITVNGRLVMTASGVFRRVRRRTPAPPEQRA